MKSNIRLIKIALCGPSDVAREIAIAQDAITEWNLQHGETSGLWLKHRHWSTDSYPVLGDRPQAIINKQMVDDSDIIVAIFWSRFGTPTGTLGSGTEEEIRRGIRLARKVLVYFSDLEPIPADAEQSQLDLLWKFRRELQSKGLCWTFSSRQQFQKEFTRHLSRVIHDLTPQKTPSQSVNLGQSIVGHNNIQVGHDLNVFSSPPVIKPVIERRADSLSSSEAKRIRSWIEQLVEETVGMPRKDAFAMWWSRFKNNFDVEKYEELPSARLNEAESWFRTQRAIQIRGLKSKAPDEWRRKRIGAIKAAMKSMGVSKESYYSEIAQRLRMKKPFTSLKDLTKRDLERVYAAVLRDAREHE
jgi:hypothetical protein